MEIETLKRSHIKRNIIIGVVAVLIISAIILNFTRAKYRSVASVPIVNSTVNYELSDLNTVAVYIQEGEDYTKTDTIPEEGYTLNQEKSYCKVNDSDINATINYDANTKTLSVSPLTTKGTKCYLYFDEYTPSYTITEIIAGYNKGNRGSFSSVYTTSTTNTVFTTTDWKGTSYYFAGAPTDNWVRFGGFYWRIVRVNGDGSVRLIYNGTSTTTTGTGTMINNGTEQVFNSSYNRSEYVGLKYTQGQQHGQTENSDILIELQSWYTSSNLDDYAEYIDTSVGFCNDRNMASGSSWSSQPSSIIYYAARERLYTNKSPSLSCTTSDIIFEPVGLITADEVAYAGGVYGSTNQSYYLYNNQVYWTMSPSNVFSSGSAYVLCVPSSGSLVNNRVDSAYGVRPVINLKANTKFQGSGTIDSPFEIAA